MRVAVVVNFITSYRLAFYRRLFSMSGLDITVFCHEPPSTSSLRSAHKELGPRVELLPGAFFGEVLVFSRLPWRKLLTSFDAVVVEGNPRYVSFALLATSLQVLRKRVVLWTMIHSYRNSKARKRIRLLWTTLFDRVLVYSDQEAKYFRAYGFSGRVVGINNGLDQSAIRANTSAWSADRLATWRQEGVAAGKKVLLSCARLEAKNKFAQFLPVFSNLLKEYPELAWIVVGDGPERANLQREIEVLGLAEHVLLIGAIFDERSLAPWFLSCEFLVHPGAIGLTLLHAFGYGVPVLTHSEASHHGPEFAAFDDGHTGLLYLEDDVHDMEKAARSLLSEPGVLERMSASARSVVEQRYNVDVMVERFLQSVR